MKNYNKKLRSTIVDLEELEILLIKQTIFAAISTGNCCTYRQRFSLYSWSDGFIIYKTEDANANILFKKNQLGGAVDAFINLFIHEENADLSEILFHQRVDGAGVGWSALATHLRVKDLANPEILALRFGAVLGQILDDLYFVKKEANSESEESDTGSDG